MKNKVFAAIGAISTGMLVAIVVLMMGNRDWAPVVGLTVMLTFFAFATNLFGSAIRNLLFGIVALLCQTGIFYGRYHQNPPGLAIAVTLNLIAIGIVLLARRSRTA